jgi:hypothetical protein
MRLRQTLKEAVNGYWDGGMKQVFDWEIEGTNKDNQGSFSRIGSWNANYWFHVSTGKSDKLTLSYAKKHLKKITRIESSFEYIQ